MSIYQIFAISLSSVKTMFRVADAVCKYIQNGTPPSNCFGEGQNDFSHVTLWLRIPKSWCKMRRHFKKAILNGDFPRATVVATALDDLLAFDYDRCIYSRHLSPPCFATQGRFRGQGVKGYLKIGLS